MSWLDNLGAILARGRGAVVVQVLVVDGSSPREVGARMVVGDDGFFGTIGGGQLEHQALAHARALTAGGALPKVVRMALGPALGQCCGGVVWLGYEPYAPADAAWVERLRNAARDPRPVVRVARLSKDGWVRDFFTVDHDLARAGDARQKWVGPAVKRLLAGDGTYRAVCDETTATMVERVNFAATPVYLFGAGHVGRALVRALAPLPFSLHWIDTRLGVFDTEEASFAHTHTLAMPELFVDEAEKNSFFLVMTHDHGQDAEICDAVLARGDFAYLGLIGSKSKRARFARRLKERGHKAEQIARLHCPIGLPGMTLKDPAVIAASVAGDLLTRISPARVITKRKTIANVRQH
ncbi:MAG: xanthine dehydrogenase accessory protein XdhC [Alphaproteobacteria bacterium]